MTRDVRTSSKRGSHFVSFPGSHSSCKGDGKVKGIHSLNTISCHYQKISFWSNFYFATFRSVTLFFFFCYNNEFCLFVMNFSLFNFTKISLPNKLLDNSSLNSFVFCGNVVLLIGC